MSLYAHVFLEAMGAKFLLPVSGEATLAAMKGFGGHNLFLAGAVAFAGAMATQIINFIVGKILLVLKNREQIFVSEVIYGKAHRLGQGWLLPLLLLAWVDFGSLLTVAAGFFNIPARKMFPVLAVAMAGYYGYVLFLR